VAVLGTFVKTRGNTKPYQVKRRSKNFCHNCGSELDSGSLFCGECGSKQS
jgi:predicted amidophosphoribosyltransferase